MRLSPKVYLAPQPILETEVLFPFEDLELGYNPAHTYTELSGT